MKKITNPEEMKRMAKWQEKLETAKISYDDTVKNLVTYQSYYDGTKIIPSANSKPAKNANTVRNITYELIESQVDPSVPFPKVTPIHEEDLNQARMIEQAINNMIRTLHISVINDMAERDVPIKGGDLYLIEWDNKRGLHSTVGEVAITEVDPRNFIPQPGIVEINKMDYFFIRKAMTKQAVKEKYGVDVEDASEEEPKTRGEEATTQDENIVTVNMSYYKSKAGNIGLYIWCDDYELYDNENYQCRELEVCVKCGAVKEFDTCDCGSKKFRKEKQEMEKLFEEKTMADGSIIFPEEEKQEIALDEYGEYIYDELGQPVITTTVVQTEIPYYQPNVYPLVLRKNVSAKNSFLGISDVKVIIDQQLNINKLGSKINEKLLRGGSYLILPSDLGVSTNGEELNIIRVDNISQANMIGVKVIQPDVSADLSLQEQNYQWAKSALGITDSFQGKYDSSATSGTAKQYAINQAAGRLESKRTMKAEAYSQLYELMFKMWLAYADQPLPISAKSTDGAMDFSELDRFMFLKIDDAGEYYWNDEFIFETTSTSSLMANREALWQQTDLKLQSGAFGPLGELDTLQIYWGFMEESNYPNAGKIKKVIDQRIEAREQQMLAQSQVQTQQGGEQIAMSNM